MNTIKNSIKDQQNVAYLFWTLAFLIVICAVAYVFMINKTVFNIVARQKAESQVTKLSSDLSILESNHLALKSKITPEFAATLGFTEAANAQFVSYDSAGTNLSFNTVR
jgi:hypothetical protein